MEKLIHAPSRGFFDLNVIQSYFLLYDIMFALFMLCLTLLSFLCFMAEDILDKFLSKSIYQ